MELRDYIKTGIEKCGDQKTTAERLGLSSQQLTNAKAHRSGIPNDAAVKLAQLLNVPAINVIAASELATEKNKERREFWFSFENHAKNARLAGLILFLAIVTNFVTPSPAEALTAQGTPKNQFVLC